eukprot:scaffold431_cov334-Pavlova_lutheri.AAC.68
MEANRDLDRDRDLPEVGKKGHAVPFRGVFSNPRRGPRNRGRSIPHRIKNRAKNATPHGNGIMPSEIRETWGVRPPSEIQKGRSPIRTGEIPGSRPDRKEMDRSMGVVHPRERKNRAVGIHGQSTASGRGLGHHHE